MVFHPLIITTYIVIVLGISGKIGLESMQSLPIKYAIFGVFLYTFLIPLVAMYWLMRMGIIQDLYIKNRSERPLPLVLLASCYFGFGYFLFSKLPFLHTLSFLIFTIAFVMLVVALISFKWQISIHAAGMGGAIGLLIGLNSHLIFIILFFLLAGCVMSSRLFLNAHSESQVYAGFGLGLLICLLSALYII